MEDHARQELLEEYFSSSGVGAPELEGFVWLKADNKKSWKKFPFVLRTSGLYYAPKGKKSSKDLVMVFLKLYSVGLLLLQKKIQNTKFRAICDCPRLSYQNSDRKKWDLLGLSGILKTRTNLEKD